MSEPYSRKDKHTDPEQEHELVVLQAMVRLEARQGDVGWGERWTKERYQRLQDKHLEAYKAFLIYAIRVFVPLEDISFMLLPGLLYS